jgi:pimeloyl-ACP methyl ester carboxylesterase
MSTDLDPAYFSAAFDAPHDRLDLPGGRLAYYRFGDGPDVVAVHGWPLHAATYRRLLPYLAPRFRVHLFDLPGTGRTEWSGPIGLETNAAAVRAAIDTIGLTRYALLAHDSGGVVARLVAAADPRVRGLVLTGSEIPGHHPVLLQVFLAAGKVPGLPGLLFSALRFGAFRRSILGFGTCFSDASYADGEFADRFVWPLTDPEVARGQMALLRDIDFAFIDRLAEVHARIQAPTLCIWGDRDPYFPIDKARAMLPQFAGGARLVAIPGAKLFPHEDHPAELASHACSFLERCAA